MNRLAIALGLLLLLALFDHSMRADQMRLCQVDDTMHCPKALWIWETFK